jgi:DNA sulfur modification protein DndC
MRPSAFKPLGLPKTVATLTEEIRELYLADQVPWIIGYSGGKDSTATFDTSPSSVQQKNPKT